jgi:hypothetical protein
LVIGVDNASILRKIAEKHDIRVLSNRETRSNEQSVDCGFSALSFCSLSVNQIVNSHIDESRTIDHNNRTAKEE